MLRAASVPPPASHPPCAQSTARGTLEASDWKLEDAVQLHFATQDGGGGGFGAPQPVAPAGGGAGAGGAGAGGGMGDDVDAATQAAIAAAQAEMAVDSPEVRAADEHVQDQLFDPGAVAAIQQHNARQAKKSGVPDPFRDLSSGAPKSGGLGDMFRTPDELMFKGSFEEARAAAEAQGKLLMVNIQDEGEFASHQLNRDTWQNATVQDIIKSHFVFWQQYTSSPEGQVRARAAGPQSRHSCANQPSRCARQMFANYYQVTKKPVVIILDAETKSKLKEWEGFVEPDTLLDHVTSFVEEHEDANTQKKQRVEARMRGASAAGAAGGGAALSTTLSAPLAAMSASDSGGASGGGGGAAMTEEQELEAAIRASMMGGGDAAAAAAEESARAPTPVVLPELPPEPEESAEGVLTLAVRLPDGTRLQRRFDGTRTLQDVFDFLHVEKSLAPGTISMVRPSPSFPAACLASLLTRRGRWCFAERWVSAEEL